MFIVKMEGFAGFVGLMFGLVVLSVIKPWSYVPLRGIAGSGFGTDSVESDFVL